MTGPTRPLTLLIAALGGEGGGVLTEWIVAAARNSGFPVQSTSVPGVAQRTGATTYYIEIVPAPWSELGSAMPVFALTPGVGDVDIVLASELLEAARAIANGFVTPARTCLIASNHRHYAITEKMAMGDGRTDPARLTEAIATHAQSALVFDMEAVARKSGVMINAVMLGALAFSGRLPLSQEALGDAIREDGKAAEANLRGFEAGLKAAAQAAENAAPAAAPIKRLARGARRLRALEADVTKAFPPETVSIVLEGVRRLYRYQGRRYAKNYVQRLKAIASATDIAEAGAGAGAGEGEGAGAGAGEGDGAGAARVRLLQETARVLAVRMSYEDVIRVAAAKIAPGRIARIRADMGAKPHQRVRIVEFLKPGLDEMCQIMPPWLARRFLAAAERRPRLRDFHLSMELDTTSVSGFFRLWGLAKLRMFRRWTHRFQEERRSIEAWLKQIREAAPKSLALAVEVAACAELLKGYGDTLRRGRANYEAIETRIIGPALAGELPLDVAIDAMASARAAALTDPEGDSLATCLAEMERRVLPVTPELGAELAAE